MPMDPAIMAGAAQAGTSLLQGLMQMHMAERQRKEDAIRAAEEARRQALLREQELAIGGSTGEQSALSNLANVFRSAYL